MSDDNNRDLRESLVDAMLEERFATERRVVTPMAKPSPSRRTRLLAAAVLLAGASIVAAVALEQRERDLPGQTQQPEPPVDRGAVQDPMDARSYMPLALGNCWEYIETGHPRGRRSVRVEVTATAVVGGREIFQVMELAGTDVTFSFWAKDQRGLHRLPSKSQLIDSRWQWLADPVGPELPSPIGSRKDWPVQIGSEGHGGLVVAFAKHRSARGAGGESLRGSIVDMAAQVRAIGEFGGPAGPVAKPEWAALRVRLVGEELSEERWLVADLGLVRQETRRGETVIVRDLAQMPKLFAPWDRQQVLQAQVGADQAAKAVWLDKGDAQWTVQSEFAVLTVDGRKQVWRVHRNGAVLFDHEDVEDYAAMAREERYDHRQYGLNVQRTAQGIGDLKVQLHEAIAGAQFSPGERKIEIGAIQARVERGYRVTAADGSTRDFVLVVVTRRGLPVEVSLDEVD